MRRAAVAAAVAALALGACGEEPRPVAEPGPAPATANLGKRPLQAANGPIAPAPATSPLSLRLVGGPDPVVDDFGKPPAAGLVFDLDTGQVLWRRNPTKVLPIASVTKLMTALLVVERVEQGAKVRITKEALRYTGSGVGVLPRGKWVGLSAMLHGLLLASGNDAAIALAQRVARTERAFVGLMNAKANEMGLTCTRFASASGIVDEGNHSCPADLAVLARAVLDEPRLAKIVARRQAVLPFPIKGGKLYLYNHNPLLRLRYPGTIGLKTGYTDKAGRCLVAAVERNGRRLGVVLLRSPDTGRQAKHLLDRAFRAIR